VTRRYISTVELRNRVSFLLLLAGLAVVVQQALTIYPETGLGPHLFWAAISMFLLWRVSRRSNLSRWVFCFLAAVGCLLYAFPLMSASGPAGLLVVAYATQAGIMLTPTVANWTAASHVPARPLATPAGSTARRRPRTGRR
jgi:hypothetical protein